ncbi:LysE family translocator [Rhizobium sp. TRM95111]|uniref:LysE family translocator n=1 Tax=Rhizobium alarense TaxID=2846851 RepID=UPI001F36A4C5|nr:LysE family translocator [Rhizobium alarense]MCF3642829.1 LysE family translocator [Rhizobium alarense]
MTAEFLATSIIVILLPGTGVLYTLALGLSRGYRASVFAAFGCTIGIVPHIAMSVVGLAALLHASATAFQFLKSAGVAYLFYMAWAVLRQKGGLDVNDSETTGRSMVQVAVNGFLLNILNPKLSLFFLAFLPQFIPAGEPHPTRLMVALGAIFMALTFVAFLGYGVFAASARRYVIARPAVLGWMRRGFAGAFALLGLRLALAER